MPTFFKVIVERRPDHWSAWFDGFPELSRLGESPSEAFQQLLALFGEELFDSQRTILIAQLSRDEHLEYLVVPRVIRGIPCFSAN